MAIYDNEGGEDVKPLSGFYSTNLSPRVTSYDTLATRIAYSLGYPLVNIELHTNNIYENISISCEMFAKFAGYTEEYLIFDSDLYETVRGIKMDKLFSITPELTSCIDICKSALRESCHDATDTQIDTILTQLATNGIESVSDLQTIPTLSSLSSLSGLSAASATSGLSGLSAISAVSAASATSGLSAVSATTTDPTTTDPTTTDPTTTDPTTTDPTTTTTTSTASGCLIVPGYDYDINDYRKVIDVWSFNQGTHTGVNTLFTLEQSLAQQTYFSYAMGNYGFDLVSWYAVKEWLELREKLLCTKPSLMFDERTQYMRLIPEPTNRYYGVVACYVERTNRDLVREQWVYQYALALSKIVVGRVRGKYSGTNLIGGGGLDGDKLLEEGLTEKEALETKLYEGAPGLGDAAPPSFIVG